MNSFRLKTRWVARFQANSRSGSAWASMNSINLATSSSRGSRVKATDERSQARSLAYLVFESAHERRLHASAKRHTKGEFKSASDCAGVVVTSRAPRVVVGIGASKAPNSLFCPPRSTAT